MRSVSPIIATASRSLRTVPAPMSSASSLRRKRIGRIDAKASIQRGKCSPWSARGAPGTRIAAAISSASTGAAQPASHRPRESSFAETDSAS